MLLLFFVWNISFIFFFSAIGMWFLSFIPIFVGLLFFLSLNDSLVTGNPLGGEQIKYFFLRYAFSFARSCIMLGMRGVLDIFAISHVWSSLGLIGVNIFLRILSYVINYRDGKEMFHIGYYVSIFLFLGSSFPLLNIQSRGEMVMIWLSLTMALYAFIVFIGNALSWEKDYKLSYPLFVLFILSLMFMIYHYTSDDVIYTLVLSQVLLMALYSLIFGIYRYAEISNELILEDNNETLKQILAGKTIKKPKISPRAWYADFVSDAYAFLTQVNYKTKWVISFLNIILIIGQIWVFLVTVGSQGVITHEILLWFGIIAFFVNYLLLKQIGFPHKLQRITSFVLINFGIYLSIVNIFGVEPVYLVGIGTVRSILNSLVMFQTKWLSKKAVLQENDYLYRIGANMLATLCNIYFMFLLPLSLQLRFFFVLMYLGIQMFLTLYNLRYIASARGKKIGITL